MILKKISFKRSSEEKNCMQHKCNRKLMGKKNRKKYPSQEIARKKVFDDQKSLPPPPQELNGRPLNWLSHGSQYRANVNLFELNTLLLRTSVSLKQTLRKVKSQNLNSKKFTFETPRIPE